jgi:hypothetical protein
MASAFIAERIHTLDHAIEARAYLSALVGGNWNVTAQSVRDGGHSLFVHFASRRNRIFAFGTNMEWAVLQRLAVTILRQRLYWFFDA